MHKSKKQFFLDSCKYFENFLHRHSFFVFRKGEFEYFQKLRDILKIRKPLKFLFNL